MKYKVCTGLSQESQFFLFSGRTVLNMLIFISVLTCSHIEIEHGSVIVDSYDVGSEARIECDRGYELEGSSSTLICLSTGRWSYIHRLPTCNGECTSYIYIIS